MLFLCWSAAPEGKIGAAPFLRPHAVQSTPLHMPADMVRNTCSFKSLFHNHKRTQLKIETTETDQEEY
jgi:hypothetical protein